MGADISQYTVISLSLCFTLDLVFVADSLNLFGNVTVMMISVLVCFDLLFNP